MLTTIQPPIKKEYLKWMKNHNWTFQENINPNEPIHIMLGHFAWHCFAVQNKRKVGFSISFRIDSVPDQFRTKEAQRLHSLASRWFSVPIDSGETLDTAMVAVASEEDLNRSAFMIDKMDCGLQLRMIPPESEELKVAMHYPDNNPQEDKPERFYTFVPHWSTIHLIISDSQNRIRAHSRLNITLLHNRSVSIFPRKMLEDISAVADIGPILAYIASLQICEM